MLKQAIEHKMDNILNNANINEDDRCWLDAMIHQLRNQQSLWDQLSEEAQEHICGTMEDAIDCCRGLGMDEGKDIETGEDHPWLEEIKDFIGYGD